MSTGPFMGVGLDADRVRQLVDLWEDVVAAYRVCYACGHALEEKYWDLVQPSISKSNVPHADACLVPLRQAADAAVAQGMLAGGEPT